MKTLLLIPFILASITLSAQKIDSAKEYYMLELAANGNVLKNSGKQMVKADMPE